MLKKQTMQTMFVGSIHPGQEVFSQDDQLIGLVTRIVSNGEEPNSYLAIRTRRLLGRQKIMPVENVSSFVPVSAIHHLTQRAGFLRKSGQDTGRVYDFDGFDLAHFSLPGEDWAPPYPYCPEDVLFPAKIKTLSEDEFYSAVPLVRIGFNEVLLKG